MASCKDCKVMSGYRPMLDYVELCSLHAAAPRLLEALKASATYGHRLGAYHSPNFVTFDECKKAECIAAREAIRKAGGE